MEKYAVITKNLSKSFYRKEHGFFRPATETKAVQDLSLTIRSGECVAFIGPNGAGKSTTVKMLTSILYPTGGSALVAGINPWENRSALCHQIGVIFGQRSQLWYHLPVRDSLHLLAVAYNLSEAEEKKRLQELSESLQVTELLDRPVRNLSLGQRMRCEIIASLLHSPQILFLDEPTIGLDVEAKLLLRSFLKQESEAKGITILLTSHDTGDIEKICHRVLLINHGSLILDTTMNRLKTQFMSEKYIRITHKDGSYQRFHFDPRTEDITHFLKSSTFNQVSDLTIENPPLEEIIRKLYQKEVS